VRPVRQARDTLGSHRTRSKQSVLAYDLPTGRFGAFRHYKARGGIGNTARRESGDDAHGLKE